jgi:DNA-directed RNA polymerase subunit H (RpoH/RPB5)
MKILQKIGNINNTANGRCNEVLVRCITTVIEMLKDRGHENIQSCQTCDEIKASILSGTRVVQSSPPGGCGKVDVYFHNEEKVGVKVLRAWLEASDANIIVVSLEGPTVFTRKESAGRVQFFTFLDMCVNITKHSLVPKHEKMTDDQASLLPFLENRSLLPLLYTNDKVAMYYDFKPGDLIRITRRTGTQHPVFYYRHVVNPPC